MKNYKLEFFLQKKLKKKNLKKKIFLYKNLKKKKNYIYIQIDGILNITTSLNNIILNYSDLFGKPKYWFSCGQIPNIQKGNRSNYFIILEMFKKFSDFLILKSVKNIYIKLKGTSLIKKKLFNGLKTSNLNIIKIFNITPISHNGCKKKKYRRI
jgi:small subunit ribosomal protein S11